MGYAGPLTQLWVGTRVNTLNLNPPALPASGVDIGRRCVMSTQESYTSSLQIERRSIDYIPAAERHGTPNRLFFIWFGANMQVTAAATGAIAVVIGLSLPWALLALLIGNLFGVTFMAAHSAQGPKLGIPQMIQSRAQFGFYGAIVPLVLVLLMYIGYFAAERDSWWSGAGGLVGDQRQACHRARLCDLRRPRHLRLPHDSPIRAVDQPGERPRLCLSDDPST